MQKPGLWERLEAFKFDADDGSKPFSVKLASAEGWSPEFTAIAIEEYRKFLYLTQVSDRQATPSEAIDRVWHMHLTFTRHYWDALCGDVLQAELHHDPCKGAEDMPRYETQYRATKALYVKEFGKDPNPMIWDGDTGETPRSGGAWLEISLLVLGGVLAAGSILGMRGGAIGLAVFGLVIAVLILMLGIALMARQSRSGNGRAGGGSAFAAGCSSKGDGGSSGCGGGGCGGGGGG